jgi:hypothetical protein
MYTPLNSDIPLDDDFVQQVDIKNYRVGDLYTKDEIMKWKIPWYQKDVVLTVPCVHHLNTTIDIDNFAEKCNNTTKAANLEYLASQKIQDVKIHKINSVFNFPQCMLSLTELPILVASMLRYIRQSNALGFTVPGMYFAACNEAVLRYGDWRILYYHLYVYKVFKTLVFAYGSFKSSTHLCSNDGYPICRFDYSSVKTPAIYKLDQIKPYLDDYTEKSLITFHSRDLLHTLGTKANLNTGEIVYLIKCHEKHTRPNSKMIERLKPVFDTLSDASKQYVRKYIWYVLFGYEI